MSLRSFLRRFRGNADGASAAEFALVLPLALLFLLGIIDAGRYLWMVNQGLKAVQVGARWAAATDFIPDTLVDYSFVLDETPALTQGDPVPAANFPGYSCTDNGASVACTCTTSLGTCQFSLATDATDHAIFMRLFGRMQEIMGSLTVNDITVTYVNSGLGFAGDPNGPDVAPFVTVKIEGVQFTPAILFGATTMNLPVFEQTLTMEDGQGTSSN